MSGTFYITTPIYYVNGRPHLGHAYTTAIADALARYQRLAGRDVCLLTGTDEHGLNIERTAQKQGLTPQQLADLNSGEFRKAWKALDLPYKEFIRTTEARHVKAVNQIS